MLKSTIFKAIVAVAIIGGGLVVIYQDEPEPPTGDINQIEPVPNQDSP